jgi:hypothetical protein
MKLFTCATCGQTIYFDNRFCVRCGSALGFLAEDVALHALLPAGEGVWNIAGRDGLFRFCDNAVHDVCNWLVPADGSHAFCEACRHNRIVPTTDPQGLERWRRIGAAQRHLFYSILRWNLPRPTREDDPAGGLVFDFLADELDANGNVVNAAMTGHEDGLISLRAAEADDAVRESVRVSMGEPYRSLLGHFRHEIGHFYWTQLVRDDGLLAEARRLFGDERENYAAALQRNYTEGPPADWQQRFISTYAAAHPAEDFAECWAHFFHIVDTLETARSFGLNTDPKGHEELEAEVTFDPYRAANAGRLVESWIPLSVALNAIQRSVGQPDSYPFVLPPPVVDKLDFINGLVRGVSQ